MIDLRQFDRRPIIVAIAGPNGAGKTTFFYAHLRSGGLRFINADILAAELGLDAYQAARAADALRRELVRRRESFVFETVFSDPIGDKVAFLEQAADSGYEVVVCFVGLTSAELSTERVAMRALRGGHDVPNDKLLARFGRTLDNLRRSIARLPHVVVYDNSDLTAPFRLMAVFERGRAIRLYAPFPGCFDSIIHEP